jgi:CHAD domain-containing protein
MTAASHDAITLRSNLRRVHSNLAFAFAAANKNRSPLDVATVNMNAGLGDKWLTGLAPEDTIGRAAQSAIENRLEFLWSCLKQAGQNENPDAEVVHQARVSARRAMAALETFEALLPKKRGAWMQKQVKRVRRAAGDARDDDVLLARLQEIVAKPNEAQGSEELPLWQVQLATERALHQVPIGRTYRKLKRKQFRHRAKQLVKGIKWRGEPPEPSYRDAAIVMVREMLAGLESTLLGAVPQEEALHPLRIAGKRLRYSLELFKDAFTTPLMQDEIYPQVEAMQDLLGKVNDHVSAIERIESWLETSNDDRSVHDLQALLHEESNGMEAAHSAFDQWWERGEAKLLCQRLHRLSEDAKS